MLNSTHSEFPIMAQIPYIVALIDKQLITLNYKTEQSLPNTKLMTFLNNSLIYNALSEEEIYLGLIYISNLLVHGTKPEFKFDLKFNYNIYFVICFMLAGKNLNDTPYDNLSFHRLSGLPLKGINNNELGVFMFLINYAEFYPPAIKIEQARRLVYNFAHQNAQLTAPIEPQNPPIQAVQPSTSTSSPLKMSSPKLPPLPSPDQTDKDLSPKNRTS